MQLIQICTTKDFAKLYKSGSESKSISCTYTPLLTLNIAIKCNNLWIYLETALFLYLSVDPLNASIVTNIVHSFSSFHLVTGLEFEGPLLVLWCILVCLCQSRAGGGEKNIFFLQKQIWSS